MGLNESTELGPDRLLCSVVVHVCREEGTTRQKARRKKKHEQDPTAPQVRMRHKASARGGEPDGAKGLTGDCG